MKNNNCSNLNAIQILNHDDERWLDYIKYHPEASPFHHPAWIALLSECYGYHPFIIVALNDDGQITAGLPMMEVKSMITGRRWVSLPFTDYCAPLYDDHESLTQLTDSLGVLYQAEGIPKIEVRWDLPPHAAIRSHTDYYLHTVRLASEPQYVLKGFKRAHRQNISTAEERGVHIEWGTEPEYLRRFYSMQLETRRRKGIPVQPWKFFDLLGRQILSQGLGFVLLAYKDAQCLAGGIFLHWQQTLTYKYAASSGEDQQYRPNNLLSWIAMRWGCENGYTVFDLGRTELTNEGLRRFKKGWGAEETPLPYSVLSATSIDTGSGKLMSFISTAIQKAPPWVCRMTGEFLYRHFG
jgi:CelD/BcsL family acetyltransferase involved in cellulose biosynthesis